MNLVESKWKRCKSKRVYLGLSQGFEWQSEPMGAATNSGLLLTIRLPSPGLILPVALPVQAVGDSGLCHKPQMLLLARIVG